ncbi:MAG: carboxymuconolactone decarboxylase family protein [Candidatus Eisenbacteria bacterium]|uniref:Carboxymuconolactone decarboxylase family protein n=1 Tax=Eiseniibacteriota bacterium TaxID=2212470 RepID=A0A956RR69_UNCEI|nr:carboxymuconolactone decarboxylase family protein [Candidatus Eisenbacteria bacterium]
MRTTKSPKKSASPSATNPTRAKKEPRSGNGTADAPGTASVASPSAAAAKKAPTGRKARATKSSAKAPKLLASAMGRADFRTPPLKKPLDPGLTGEPYRATMRNALRDSGLPRRIAHGAVLPALLADGRMGQLREQIDWAIEDRVPAFYMAESFLQSYLFVGFPRVINALAMLHDVSRARRRSLGLAAEALHVQTEIPSFDRILGGPTDFGMGLKGRRIRLAEGPPMHLEAPGEGPGSFERYAREWWRRGAELCQQVYGNQFERLRENLGRIHPELSDWMLFEGYGKVLSRPVLTPRERELWIIPMLMVQDVPEQFYSHLRGARNLEVPASRIQGVVWLGSMIAGPTALSRALDRLEELERRDEERRREFPFG